MSSSRRVASRRRRRSRGNSEFVSLMKTGLRPGSKYILKTTIRRNTPKLDPLTGSAVRQKVECLRYQEIPKDGRFGKFEKAPSSELIEFNIVRP